MAEFKNPFLDFDVQKMMGEFKIPNVDVDGIVAAHKRNFDAIAQANQIAAEGMQAIMRRQSEIAQAAIAEVQSNLQAIATQGAPEEKLAQQAAIAKSTLEQALANLKELQEMVAKSNAEASGIINKRIMESLDEVKTAIEKSKK
ncbi:TIGR01841 family phasin [Thalassobaculum sp. OXR-137]|uniref:phasin family protein n=1 Tax=Thalassobaculum sp. OXR-137 TaxID=3100173 RepID=UPI002AC980BD|nr:TIGR01841 family phasin [Thalassobaculum sp. OXR-137]WPZ36780.1 TIGR01841 family phasin [Thalassobaculum sp. OXR-137]